MTKHIILDELVDQRDIVGDLLSNIVWKYKSDFLLKAKVLANSLYCIGNYTDIKKFVNTYFPKTELGRPPYDFNSFNTIILKWCEDTKLNDCENEFIEILLTKVLNDIISNVLNIDGSVDSCALDYNDIVESVAKSDVSQSLLEYFHTFLLNHIDLVDKNFYDIDIVNTDIDMSKYGLDNVNHEISIPRYIEDTYITLIRNPKIKSYIENKDLISKGTEEHKILESMYMGNINPKVYHKLMAFYIKDCEYYRADIYITSLGDYKIVKKNTY